MSEIVVVGSCMIDFVSFASKLPTPGETIHGKKFLTNFGGKGANQCIAAAKLGASTKLIASLGDDYWGCKYLSYLKTQKIDTEFIAIAKNATTGVAQIIVDENRGENQIVIVAGANNLLTIDSKAEEIIKKASVLIVQLETSVEVAIKTLELCQGMSILNGAPALSDFNEKLLTLPTIFCVNESEATIFTGIQVENKSQAKLAACSLISKGCNNVIITLGSEGAFFLSKTNPTYGYNIPTRKIRNIIDSTGAGDAFIGALAYFLVNNLNSKWTMPEMIKMACFVASDCVQREGTQNSFADKEVLSEILS